MKNCSSCLELKGFNDFYKCKQSKDGFTWYCKQCTGVKQQHYRHKNQDSIRVRKRAYDNSERGKKAKAESRRRNREWYSAYSREYYKNNICKIKNLNSQFFILNPTKRAEYSSSRRARVKNRELFRQDASIKREISEKFVQAKLMSESTGIIHEVDHIIPILNDTVCGLHVPWNMQILSKYENALKNNKFDGTYNNDSWKLLINGDYNGKKD